jgi:hypothetical protein
LGKNQAGEGGKGSQGCLSEITQILSGIDEGENRQKLEKGGKNSRSEPLAENQLKMTKLKLI